MVVAIASPQAEPARSSLPVLVDDYTAVGGSLFDQSFRIINLKHGQSRNRLGTRETKGCLPVAFNREERGLYVGFACARERNHPAFRS
jgi:hypothetical protein